MTAVVDYFNTLFSTQEGLIHADQRVVTKISEEVSFAA